MRSSSSPAGPRISAGHRNLLLVAAVFAALLVTMGAVVCATESGEACPDWPGCFGKAIPPPEIHAIIEYTHRVIAALTTPLIVAAAVVGWRRARGLRLASWLPMVAVLFALAAGAFGALTVLTGLPRGWAAVDLGSALIVVTLMVAAATAAWARYADPGTPDRLCTRSSLARLAAATLGAVYAVYVGGVLVAGDGSMTRCLSWPIWRVLPDDLGGWPQVARLTVAAIAALLVLTLVVSGLRQRGNRGVCRATFIAAIAFFVEMLVGAIMMSRGASPLLAVVYVAAAVLLWCMLVLIGVAAGLAAAGRSSAT